MSERKYKESNKQIQWKKEMVSGSCQEGKQVLPDVIGVKENQNQTQGKEVTANFIQELLQ